MVAPWYFFNIFFVPSVKKNFSSKKTEFFFISVPFPKVLSSLDVGKKLEDNQEYMTFLLYYQVEPGVQDLSAVLPGRTRST